MHKRYKCRERQRLGSEWRNPSTLFAKTSSAKHNHFIFWASVYPIVINVLGFKLTQVSITLSVKPIMVEGCMTAQHCVMSWGWECVKKKNCLWSIKWNLWVNPAILLKIYQGISHKINHRNELYVCHFFLLFLTCVLTKVPLQRFV